MTRRNYPYLITLFSFTILLIFSCQHKESDKERIVRLVTEWQGRDIIFPQSSVFTRYVTDTVNWQIPESDYKVLIYVDSVGCTSCKLQLNRWKEFMATVDSVAGREIPFLFYFQSTDYKEIRYLLRRDQLDLPVCVDADDQLNKLNNFPSNITFQTFLLDKDNKVVVIGNPIHNLSVKDLYLKQLTGGDTKPNGQSILTTAEADVTDVDFGSFDQSETKTALFTIRNTGDMPLVIIDVATTCGCARAIFDKHPAEPGQSLQVKVEMSPKEKGFFSETLTVKCNTDKYIKLKIRGQAT